MTTFRRPWSILPLLALVWACEGEGPVDPDPVASAIEVVAGAGQTGTVGQPLTEPVAVEVRDEDGDPIAGVPITIEALGGGSVAGDDFVSDAQGRIAVAWTLGTVAGAQTLRASISVDTTLATATALAGPAASIEKLSGDEQTGTAGVVLPTPLAVRVSDAFGNPVPNTTVVWTGIGSFTPASSTTDANGESTTSWQLGPSAGTQQAVPTSNGQSATFTATAQPLLRSAAEAAAFVVQAAAILTAYSDPDDSFATFQLAGGPGARGAIQPPADSLPPQLCMNPRNPEFYAREHRGLTYVWDPVRASYVWSTQPGAPICAIRITRYTHAAGRPAVPLERLGYIEVRDLYSPGPRSGVGFSVVSDTGAAARTLTEYLSSRWYQFYTRAYTEDWDLVGFFDRDGDRFDFDFNQFTSAGEISGMSYHNVSGSSRFSGGGIVLTSTRTPSAYTLIVRRGDSSVEFRMDKPADSASFRGQVITAGPWSYEGVVGTITGSPDAPTFRDNIGGALPPEVEGQLESFWASLLGMFGLHRWPHV